MITQSYLKSILDYNPDTGVFTWLVNRYSGVNYNRCHTKTGDIAGCINKTHGYIVIRINQKGYLAHRLAWLYMYDEFPPEQIDHINHDKADNRICNLRAVSRQENGKNQSKPISNTSGHVGVSWHKHKNKWRARIKVNQKDISLGYFNDINDAITFRKQAEIDYGFHENHGKKHCE